MSSPLAWQGWIGSQIELLRALDLLRTLKPLIPGQSAVEVLVTPDVLRAWTEEGEPQTCDSLPGEGSVLRLFSSNDYMGLSCHPSVLRAAADAVLRHGMGPRSSAVVGGYTFLHEELERALADLKQTEDCLLFPTGFAANVAVVTALCSAADVTIFSDELNHASIIDGARLASRQQGKVVVYRHNDMQHLEKLLSACPANTRKFVITDSLFSMDGDFADLAGLAALRREHSFMLAVDDAHATFVCGQRGGGAAEMFGVSEEVDVHIGTLSKAAGAHGGFVACSAALKSLLLNKGRPYVFSTALAVPVVAAALAAVRVNEEEPERREHLWRLVQRLGQGLGVEAESPIVPLIVGSEAAALKASAQLLQRGFYVPAIRPPTVAPGTSRLRVSLSAAHREEDVDGLLQAMRDCGIIPVIAAPTPTHAHARL